MKFCLLYSLYAYMFIHELVMITHASIIVDRVQLLRYMRNVNLSNKEYVAGCYQTNKVDDIYVFA
jgi:hypothetical protein